MSKIRKQVTDNPIIDEIVYQCQNMLKGIVLKDEAKALANETLFSIKQSDLYAAIIENKDRYEFFNYSYDMIASVPGINKDSAILYANDNRKVPKAYRESLQRIARNRFLESYEEPNNYYRTLAGLPDYGESGLKLSKDEKDMIPVEEFDTTKYVHEYGYNETKILYSCGAIDSLLEKHPNCKYLNHLGERSINPYIARKTPKFGILYIPPCDSTEVYNKFRDRIEINRVYVLKTIYSEAYKFESEYYDNFMMMMILIQAMDDMIVLSPEYIIDRELFDLRTIQFLFEASGVEFYPEIPLRYQKRLVKNLNRLIKYKSCNKNLIDIVSLFGFEDIQLFKYYLLKQPIMNEDGTYKHDTYTDPKTGEEVEDLDSNYKLKFIKCPIDESYDKAIKDPINFSDYDEIIRDDMFWNGIYTDDYVKNEILKHEFNICISKYISVDTVYSLTELSFELSYFINMIMFSKVDTSQLLIPIPKISSTEKFPLVDLLVCLYSLMYMYNEVKDNIFYDPVQSMAIKGFNFETDMSILSSYIAEKGYTLEELGVSGYQNPSSILTFDQLLEVYTNNKNIYSHIVHEMINADNKKIYDIYKTIYDSLMVTHANFEYYKKYGDNGKVPNTYSKYLYNKNSPLYSIIEECNNIDIDKFYDNSENLKVEPNELLYHRAPSKASEEKKLAISQYINTIIDNIYLYLDKDTFGRVFQNIPTVSLDYIKSYLFKVLMFFKSYKTDLIHSNNVYRFDDQLENKIMIIDEIIFGYILNPDDKVNIDDYKKLLIKLNLKEGIPLIEQLYFDITWWYQMLIEEFDTKTRIKEELSKHIHITYSEHIDLKEILYKVYVFHRTFNISINDTIDDLKVSFNKNDNIELDEAVYFDIVRPHYTPKS